MGIFRINGSLLCWTFLWHCTQGSSPNVLCKIGVHPNPRGHFFPSSFFFSNTGAPPQSHSRICGGNTIVLDPLFLAILSHADLSVSAPRPRVTILPRIEVHSPGRDLGGFREPAQSREFAHCWQRSADAGSRRVDSIRVKSRWHPEGTRLSGLGTVSAACLGAAVVFWTLR